MHGALQVSHWRELSATESPGRALAAAAAAWEWEMLPELGHGLGWEPLAGMRPGSAAPRGSPGACEAALGRICCGGVG